MLSRPSVGISTLSWRSSSSVGRADGSILNAQLPGILRPIVPPFSVIRAKEQTCPSYLV